eukprot:gene10099-biopygen1792
MVEIVAWVDPSFEKYDEEDGTGERVTDDEVGELQVEDTDSFWIMELSLFLFGGTRLNKRNFSRGLSSSPRELSTDIVAGYGCSVL